MLIHSYTRPTGEVVEFNMIMDTVIVEIDGENTGEQTIRGRTYVRRQAAAKAWAEGWQEEDEIRWPPRPVVTDAMLDAAETEYLRLFGRMPFVSLREVIAAALAAQAKERLDNGV